MVRMWQARSVLIWSIIEASVVDLPEPVGPVTRIRPWCSSAKVAHDRRQAELVHGRDLAGDDPQRHRGEPRWLNALPRTRATSRQQNEKSYSRRRSSAAAWSSVSSSASRASVSRPVSGG